MFKTPKLILIFTLLAGPILAISIPTPIKEYLDANALKIRSALEKPFNEQEREKIANKIATKLINRYDYMIEDLAQIKNELSKELIQYNLKTIFPAIKAATKESTVDTSPLIKKAMQDLTNVYPSVLTNSIVRIAYKNEILPLTLLTENDNLIIKLHGAPLVLPKRVNDYADQCLNLKVDRKLNVAEIRWLGSMETACPLATNEREGEFLLTLAEDLLKALGVKAVQLIDQAKVLCKQSLEQVDLRRLRLFQKKKGWYEGHGYFVFEPATKEKLSAIENALGAMKLSDFAEFIAQMKQSTKTKIFREKMTEYQDKASMSTKNSLAAFMAWLWEQDCMAYAKIDELLLNYEDKKNFPYLGNTKIRLGKKF